MRQPLIITSPAGFILIGAAAGGVAFAGAGAILGFFSFLHWLAGAGILFSTAKFMPKIVEIDHDPR